MTLFRKLERDHSSEDIHTKESSSSSRYQARVCRIELLEPRTLLALTTPVISEFMAINDTTVQDGDGLFSDWIEVYNPTASPLNLSGYHLTDNQGNLDKWEFPSVTVNPDEHLLVFATGEPSSSTGPLSRVDAGGFIHTNFKLDGDGEFLALVDTDGSTILQSFGSQYPPQFPDVSYGIDVAGTQTTLVGPGSELSYLIPTAGDAGDIPGWTAIGYDDSAFTDQRTIPSSSIVITEIGTGSPDQVEIQNVSGSTIDTSGWVVAFNDPSSINAVHGIGGSTGALWSFATSMTAGQIETYSDSGNPPIQWDTTGDGWAMILDDEGNVSDFVIWGYSPTEIATFDVTINGTQVTAVDLAAGVWTGASAPVNGVGSSGSLKRTGGADNNNNSDWGSFTAPHTIGVQNTSLTLPFAVSTSVPAITGIGFDTSSNSIPAGLQNGLLGYWNFDGGFNDLSGNGNNAIANGNASASSNVLNLDGSGDSAQLPLGASNPFDGSEDFSISMKFNTTVGGVLISSARDNTPGNHSMALWVEGNGEIAYDNFFVDGFRAEGTNYADGTDHTVQLTYNASGTTFNLYVDGSLEASGSFDPDIPSIVNDTILVGSTLNTEFPAEEGVGDFNGTIDDVVVYERALSLSELDEVRTGGLGGGSLFGDLINTDIETVMHGVNNSAWIRIPFELTDPSSVSQLTLDMIYDDGFIAYLNGTLVASDNAPIGPFFNSEATAQKSDATARNPVAFDLTSQIGELVTGTNVLAIWGLNYMDDGDFFQSPELIATSTAATSIPAARFYGNPTPGSSNDPSLFGPAGVVTIDTPGQSFVEGSSLLVGLSVDSPTAAIRYTTDGSVPTSSSTLYTGSPITISATTELRARAVETGFLDGPIVGEGYIEIDNAGGNALTGFQSYLPIVVIENFGGLEVAEGAFRDFNMSIFEPDTLTGLASVVDNPTVSTRIGMHIRGQSSVGFEKQQYRVETRDQLNNDLDFDLLGLGSESDFVLNGPWVDKSQIRNAFEFDLSRSLGLLAPETRYVELYLHQDGGTVSEDDYRGIYVLMEDIAIGDQSVDIPELTPSDVAEPEISGGYLMRFEEGPESQPLIGWQSLELVDDEIYTTAQYTWISNYINAFDAALPEGANFGVVDFEDYLDVGAWANYIVFTELVRDQDSYVASAYLFKDRGGKLVPGPQWDKNLTMGVGGFHDNQNLTGWQFDVNTGDAFYTQGEREWNRRLFLDSDFSQLFIDSWHAARQDQLEVTNLFNRVDSHADYLRDPDGGDGVDSASVHNFNKYPANLGDPDPGFSSPVTATWEQQITFIKNSWLTPRIAWIDSQFVPAPIINQSGGEISPPINVNFTLPASGNIYYTTDGSDPRAAGGGVSGGATLYTGGNIVVSSTTEIRARVLDLSNPVPAGTALIHREWSGLISEVFTVAPLVVPGDVVVTEINYNPAQPTATEVAAGFTDNDDFEFIEIQNISGHPVNMAGVAFTVGINFTFGNVSLANGERVVVVKNQAAFEERYGLGVNVAGVFTSGSLSNGGEQLVMVTSTAAVNQDFEYNDGDRWPERADGVGSSLEVVDTAGNFSDEDNYQASNEYLGTPGAAGTGPGIVYDVIINEILSNSGASSPDRIELFNSTGSAVDLSKWYLSDSDTDLFKYQIPDGTTILPGEYLVLSEDTYFGSAFALDGDFEDQLWLVAADNVTGTPLRFADEAQFLAAFEGVSFGRVPNASPSTPGSRFFPVLDQSFDSANSATVVSDLVISEVHYSPTPPPPAEAGNISQEDLEFLELQNVSGAPLDVSDWQIDGFGVTFAGGTIIPTDGIVVLVRFDPAVELTKATAFRNTYGIDGTVTLIGPTTARLDDNGENLEVLRPQDPGNVATGYVVVDAVLYNEKGLWPTSADALGDSLHRTAPSDFGNFHTSWNALAPTPGMVDFASADFNADTYVSGLDFLIWQRGVGIQSPNATRSDGDADNDKDVDSDDLSVWELQYGSSSSSSLEAVVEEEITIESSAVIATETASLEPDRGNPLATTLAETEFSIDTWMGLTSVRNIIDVRDAINQERMLYELIDEQNSTAIPKQALLLSPTTASIASLLIESGDESEGNLKSIDLAFEDFDQEMRSLFPWLRAKKM